MATAALSADDWRGLYHALSAQVRLILFSHTESVQSRGRIIDARRDVLELLARGDTVCGIAQDGKALTILGSCTATVRASIAPQQPRAHVAVTER